MYRCLAALLIGFAIPAGALSFGFDVTIRNDLDFRVDVELRQYHGPEFDGTPPDEWTDEFLLSTFDGPLAPGEADSAEFSTAAGGFWVVWEVSRSGSSEVLCKGVYEWGAKKSSDPISLSEKNCSPSR